jgi:hypothetical protein
MQVVVSEDDGGVDLGSVLSGETSQLGKTRDIDAADANHAWAVAEQAIYFCDGTSWSKQAEFDKPANAPNLAQVTVADRNHVWVFGNGTGFSTKEFVMDLATVFVTYFFDGSSWRKVYQGTGRVSQACAMGKDQVRVLAAFEEDDLEKALTSRQRMKTKNIYIGQMR